MPSHPLPLPRGKALGPPASRDFAADEAVPRLQRALTRVVRLTRPRLHRPALAGVGALPLDPAAYATLLLLAERPDCRLTELAALLSVDVSTTSRQVGSLERAGLVVARRDDVDQRVRRLALSPAGSALLTAARSAREEALFGYLAGWEAVDVAALASLLERLAESLGERAGLELEEAT
ncbi:MAG TPA: MarR family winged helix-turn-helix transcriptional regulator [Acidimicrobiales bacterium]|nr:MarR family winged helix-turn-helix transcriptional regulator [Acidimicrobiales bacterium]